MTKKEQRFVATVWEYYKTHGRHGLPWRQTQDPYLILVSELMLQQTQVERVIPKYETFVARWPTAEQLGSVPLSDVLKMWQGLGYNRRAKYLHECAKVVASDYAGQFPRSESALRELPGIGPYTAAAICAFAYNQPVVLIETNVRQVYIHHFFDDKTDVTDVEILRLVECALPLKNPREWYAALMDYGTYLKKQYGNLTKKSKHYTKQSKFKGSDRQIRGAILRTLVGKSSMTKPRLSTSHELSSFAADRIEAQLEKLVLEGLVAKERNSYILGS